MRRSKQGENFAKSSDLGWRCGLCIQDLNAARDLVNAGGSNIKLLLITGDRSK